MDVTRAQFGALLEAGIIGKVEHIGGRMLMAGIPMTLSKEQRAAAAEAGIDLSSAQYTSPDTAERLDVQK